MRTAVRRAGAGPAPPAGFARARRRRAPVRSHVRNVRVAVGHGRASDRDELEHQDQIHDEEERPERDQLPVSQAPHDERRQEKNRRGRGVILERQRAVRLHRVRMEGGQVDRRDRANHVAHQRVHRDQGPLVEREPRDFLDGALGPLRHDGEYPEREREHEEGTFLDQHGPPRPPPHGDEVDRDQGEGQCDGHPLGENREDEEEERCRVRERSAPIASQPDHVARARQNVEEAEEEVLPLRHPCHRLHVHRWTPWKIATNADSSREPVRRRTSQKTASVASTWIATLVR